MKVNLQKGGNTTTTIAHELYHSYEYAKGELNPNRIPPIGNDQGNPNHEDKGIRESEYNAVQFENVIRKSLGLELRDEYGEGGEGVRTGLDLEQREIHDYSQGMPEDDTDKETTKSE